MTKLNQVYKCNICGNITEVLHIGAGELVCCGAPMELLRGKTNDQGQEKHMPVVEKTEDKIKVKIGEIPHPMEEKHFIEWIEVISDEKIYRKYLKPEDKPEAEFQLKAKKFKVRAYCNIHGLWEMRS